MDESLRLKKSWARIEHWLRENFPESLDKLLYPAIENHIAIIEETIGISFPPALVTLLLLHNGEKGPWPPGLFPNGQRFLPVQAILATWKGLKKSHGKRQNLEDSGAYWRALVDDRIISIEGPVKPLFGSDRWIPISMDSDNTTHFLDYDPPHGGTPGQVIAANPDKGMYRLLAPSFIHYMEKYAMDLAVNKYTLNGDLIVLATKQDRRANKNPVPEYLKKVAYQYYNPKETSDHPQVANLDVGEQVVIVGEMTSLMGEDEVLFSLQTEQGKEYTFIAKPAFTKGHGTIAIDQYARVKARKFYGEIQSHFIEHGLAKKPDFVAMEYTMLRMPQQPTRTQGLLSGARNHSIEKLARDILDSIQLRCKDHHEYHEVTPEQLDSLQAQFYHQHTTRFLKLGFSYICDLPDRALQNTNGSGLFRVMSSADDGVVASFYPLKPPLQTLLMRWGKQELRRVLQFETQFSNGHIIISTTAADSASQPLPETITQYCHPSEISLKGLLHKHRTKIQRYQAQHSGINIAKVNKTDEFFALRNRQCKLISDHIRSIGWVSKEYLAKQIKNQKIASQVYDRIQRIARH
jgi:cell wall assembly regulator SMI1